MKDVEITCEVYENIEKIQNTLIEKGFKHVETFTLDDIYMYNKKTQEYFIKDNKITDTLIIRNVDHKDPKIVCKKRNYNAQGTEISTNKTTLKIIEIKQGEELLNALGYERYLRMIDTNHMYENEKCRAFIQEIKDLGTFLEVEAKNTENEEEAIADLINYVKELGLNIGTKFDIRKAELYYQRNIQPNKN